MSEVSMIIAPPLKIKLIVLVGFIPERANLFANPLPPYYPPTFCFSTVHRHITTQSLPSCMCYCQSIWHKLCYNSL